MPRFTSFEAMTSMTCLATNSAGAATVMALFALSSVISAPESFRS